MFKKIGIFVKENSSKSVDENALDSMLSFFTDQNIKLYIDDLQTIKMIRQNIFLIRNFQKT